MPRASDRSLILLSQDADSIPFDVKVFRCIAYKQSIQGARELKEKLIAGVKAVAQSGSLDRSVRVATAIALTPVRWC
jgi:hypothetical protein